MFDLCVAWDSEGQEELHHQVLSEYTIIYQVAGTTLARWQDHT